MARIREFDPERDAAGVRACMVELQDHERGLDPGMPPGEAIADAYLERMFERGRRHGGVVLVAEALEEEGGVAGFVSVWTRYRSDEPDDDPTIHAYVSDLVVAAGRRGTGLGRALLREAELRAREVGAPFLRLGVKAGNTAALALYAAEGFRESEISLRKPLA